MQEWLLLQLEIEYSPIGRVNIHLTGPMGLIYITNI